MSNEKCPYAKYIAKDFNIHIDCLLCPSSVCNYPWIYEQFWEKRNERENEDERDAGIYCKGEL